MRIFLVLITFMLLNACQSESKEPLLQKKWHMVYDLHAQLQTLDSTKKALLDSLPEKAQKEALKLIETQIKQNTFQFKKDHTFELSTKGAEVRQKGTWKLKDERKLILMQENPKSYNELIIQKLNQDTLILSSMQENGAWIHTTFIDS